MGDECPHRRAPLSRGRLYMPHRPPARGQRDSSAGGGGGGNDDGDADTAGSGGGGALLECAYHGWQFDGAGRCVRLPQLLPPGYPAAAAPAAAGDAVDAPAAGPGKVAEAAPAPAAEAGLAAAAAPAARRIPRSCGGRAYPTAVAQGMVWVWFGGFGGGGAGSDAGPNESKIPLDFAEEGSRRGETWALVDVFSRDFPYDWETMVENVVDPAHVAFAHDGTGQGLDRHASPPLELQILESGPQGISGRFRGVRAAPPPPISPSSAASAAAASTSAAASAVSFLPGAWSDLQFRPPCLVSLRFRLPGRGEAGLVLYCVPLGRGRSRMIARLPRNFATGWLAGLQPRWAKHLPRMAVLDQDIDLLREQEAAMGRARLVEEASRPAVAAAPASAAGQQQRMLSGAESPGPAAAAAVDDVDAAATAKAAPGGGGEWRRRYVMPAPADRFVIAFRRWMDSAGPSRPWALPPSCGSAAAATVSAVDPLKREEVLDRYHSHVKSCSACSGALAAFTRLSAVARWAGMAALAIAAGLAAAAAVTAAATAIPAPPAAAAAAATTGGGGAAVAAAAAAAAALAAACWACVGWCEGMVQKFHYTEEGRELRMNEDRWLRRLLFSGTNSFNSMVALTSKRG